MSQELPFDPFPFIGSPHPQTILSSMINFFFEPVSEQKIVHLPDGDQLSLEITTPKEWKPTDLTVMMVHGLCGSHRSSYLVRMVKKLEPLGVRVIRVNLRGCGSGKGLAKQMYLCGCSEDIFEAIKSVKVNTPDSPIVLIGFSLGGNIVLKTGGELGSLGPQFLSKVIAISPPVDLYSSVIMLGMPQNAIYESYFVRLMLDDVRFRHKKFRDLPRIKLPKKIKILEFDQIYTSKMYGFKNAHDYYNKCSAGPLVSDISVPCKILLAEDDPIISANTLDSYEIPSCVEIFKTKKGGHMGYLGNPADAKGFYWLDSVLMDWILKN